MNAPRVGQPIDSRRHDLDWLRVGAFLLLIFYHIGMFYVPWGWHVKSGHAPVAALELPMLLLNSWRLLLLFFISGVALRFAWDKADAGPFLRRRTYVLLVPLVFGMVVICAPQTWHELRQAGDFDGSVFTFYMGYISLPWASPPDWPMITPTWNHLWYLLYVFVYTILIIATARGLERRFSHAAASIAVLVSVPLIHMGLTLALWDYVGAQQTLWGDWLNLTVSGLTMLWGFLIAKEARFWAFMRHWRGYLLHASLVLSGAVAAAYVLDVPRSYELMIRILHGWAVVWAVLAWGQILLTRQTPLLRYLSAAVFTFYIVHQTIIIMAGVPLARLSWPLWAEALSLIAITVLGCVAVYAVARRMGRWGILLGARN